MAREWHGKKHIAWTPGHQKKILARLENQLFPCLGNRSFSSLEVSDYLGAIQKAEARGTIETAHRLAQLCGQISRYARISGIAKHDVAAGLTEALSPVQTKHIRGNPPSAMRYVFSPMCLCALVSFAGRCGKR